MEFIFCVWSSTVYTQADSSVDFISSERGSSETSDSGFDSLIVQKHVNRKRSSACSLVKFRSTTPPYTLIDRLRLVDGLYLFVTCLDEIPQDDIEQSNQQLCRRFGEGKLSWFILKEKRLKNHELNTDD